MNLPQDLPPWLALPVAALVLAGAALVLFGAIGLLRFRSFYERLHAPTLGTSWGTAAILLASMLLAGRIGGRWVVHELVLGVFVMITTPVALMLLGQAALHRDRHATSAGDAGPAGGQGDRADDRDRAGME